MSDIPPSPEESDEAYRALLDFIGHLSQARTRASGPENQRQRR